MNIPMNRSPRSSARTDAADDSARCLMIERARTLGERMLPQRAGLDEKAFADLVLAELRAEGLLAAVVPPAYGGVGLSVGEVARVTQYIARVSGSAGLLYAMHMSQLLSVVRHGGTSEFFEDLLRRAVRDQILFASGTSEKGLGGDILHSLCVIEEDAKGGLSVTKEIPNISYVDHAGAVLVTAMRPGPKGATQVLIAAEAAGIAFTPGREAGFIGMRGLLNRSYKLTARFPAAAIFPQRFAAISRDTMAPSIHIFWAAVWSGIAARALQTAKAFVANEMAADDATCAVVAHELTRLCDKHHAMNALIRDAIIDFDTLSAAENSAVGAAGFKMAARSNRLKVTCSQLLNEINQGALELIGIRGYAEGGPYSLSEPLRDGLSGSLMVSNYRLSANNAKLERFIEEEI